MNHKSNIFQTVSARVKIQQSSVCTIILNLFSTEKVLFLQQVCFSYFPVAVHVLEVESSVKQDLTVTKSEGGHTVSCFIDSTQTGCTL